jgi:hypothetical protein
MDNTDFKPFMRQNVNLGDDGITLARGGSICFPGGFRERHNMDQYSSVELHASQKSRKVAIKLSNAKPSRLVARIVKHGKSGREAHAAEYIKLAESWGYPLGRSLSYQAYDDDLIVLEKGEATVRQDTPARSDAKR